MAQGDKRPVVMEADLATPGGPATLDENGILAESQRPSVDDLGAANNTLSNIPDPARALYNIGAKPGDNLLINADFRCPVNRNGGQWLIPPGTPYYSDTGLTAQVGTLTEYTTGIAMTGVYGGVIVDGVVYYVDWTVVVRGYTSNGADVYTIDCWRIDYALARDTTVLIEKDGINLRTGTQYGGLFQRTDLQWFEAGPYTFSVLFNGEVSKDWYIETHLVDESNVSVTGTSSFDKNLTTGVNFVTVNIPTAGMYWFKTFICCKVTGSTESVWLKAAKLELGPVQTLAHQDADGNWVLNDPPNYALQYALCSLYSPTTGEWVGYQHSNPNLLDDGYFADPIDQRQGYVVPPDTPYYSDTGLTTQAGTVSAYTTATNGNGTYGTITVSGTTYYVAWSAAVRGYAGAGYGPDRWVRVDADAVVLIKDSGIQFCSGWGIRQRVENQRIRGRQVTLSALAENGELASITIDVPASGDFDSASAEFASGANIDLVGDGAAGHCEFRMFALSLEDQIGGIVAAKLELGPVQTLAHQDADGNWVLNDPPPNKALELAKCQRCFLYKFRTTIAHTMGALWATTSVFPVVMRTTPTIIYPIRASCYGEPDIILTSSDISFALDERGLIYCRSEKLDTTKSYGLWFPGISADL